MDNLINIAQKFVKEGNIIEITRLGEGNINQTFLVAIENKHEQISRIVLQQINNKVFTKPTLLMDNIAVFNNHANYKLSNDSLWQTPQIIFTTEKKHHYIDDKLNFWRGISYIENASSYDTIKNLNHACEIGKGLGIFHTLISDLDVKHLADTLPGFHITPHYYEQYQSAKQRTTKSSKEVNYCHLFIKERANIIDILEKAKQRGILKLRPIHGDPKINNIMIDNCTHKAIAMVDLDTIKPGLIHYDIGDCLRSGCNLLGEETQDIRSVNFNLEIASQILKGYLAIAKKFITSEEITYIYDSIRLITFELGLRFFTDYLNNNIYFKTNYSQHNLQRALVQFQLVKSIEEQEQAIKKIITQLTS